MLRAIGLVIKVAIIVAAFVWLSNRPGTVDIEWLGYEVNMQVGFGLAVTLTFILLVLVVHRIYLWLASYPARLRQAKLQKHNQKGQRALLLGLTALAAGDSRLAGYHAYQTRKYLPKDQGLTVLLEAQSANLDGDYKEAANHYKQLMSNKDTAFLGLRGLISQFIQTGDKQLALEYAGQAHKMYPKQIWILQLVYRLQLEQRLWDEAERSLQLLMRLTSAKDAEQIAKINSDQVALLIWRADTAVEDGARKKAEKLLKTAVKIDDHFVPAVNRLARLHLRNKRGKAAMKLVEKCWAVNPHPDLAQVWDKLAPRIKPSDTTARLRWFEKLIHINRDSAESFIITAQAAIEDSLWGEAEQFLDKAEQLQPSARVYRTYSKLSEARGKSEDARYWMEKAADAPASKVWSCRLTGRIYERWLPVAEPHGSFNTITWDYPVASLEQTSQADMQAAEQIQFYEKPEAIAV